MASLSDLLNPTGGNNNNNNVVSGNSTLNNSPPLSVTDLLIKQSNDRDDDINNNNNNNNNSSDSNTNSNTNIKNNNKTAKDYIVNHQDNNNNSTNIHNSIEISIKNGAKLMNQDGIRIFQNLLINHRSRHMKKNDSEPYWRNEIQFEFLINLLLNNKRVFKNPFIENINNNKFDWPAYFNYYFDENKNLIQNNGHILTFFELYLITLLKSNKISKILKARLMIDINYALNFAIVCLLVNIGRLNTTVNFDYEMKSQFRTYHSIPSLQVGNHFQIIKDYYNVKEDIKDDDDDTKDDNKDKHNKDKHSKDNDNENIDENNLTPEIIKRNIYNQPRVISNNPPNTSITHLLKNYTSYTMSTIKQLQDTPRIKSILKSVNDLTDNLPKSYNFFINSIAKKSQNYKSFNYNIVSIIFLICQNEYDIGQSFFPFEIQDPSISKISTTGSLLNDIWLRPKFKASEKVDKFLWLIYTLYQTDLSLSSILSNPFNIENIEIPNSINEKINSNYDLANELSVINHKSMIYSPTMYDLKNLIPHWTLPSHDEKIISLINDFDTREEVEFATQMKHLRMNFVKQESQNTLITSIHSNNLIDDDDNSHSNGHGNANDNEIGVEIDNDNDSYNYNDVDNDNDYDNDFNNDNYDDQNDDDTYFHDDNSNIKKNKKNSKKTKTSGKVSKTTKIIKSKARKSKNENDEFSPKFYHPKGSSKNLRQKAIESAFMNSRSYNSSEKELYDDYDNNDYYNDHNIGSINGKNLRKTNSETDDEIINDDDDFDNNDDDDSDDYYDYSEKKLRSKNNKSLNYRKFKLIDPLAYIDTSNKRGMKRTLEESLEFSAVDPIQFSSYDDNFEDLSSNTGFFNYGYPKTIINENEISEDGSPILTSCVKKRKTRKQSNVESAMKATVDRIEMFLNKDNKSVNSTSKNALLKRDKYRMISEFLFEVLKYKQLQAKKLRHYEGNWKHFTKHLLNLNMFIEKENNSNNNANSNGDWGEFKTTMMKVLFQINWVINERIKIDEMMEQNTPNKEIKNDNDESFIDDIFAKL